jgi:sugar lactone lactonase YvrE
VQETIATSVPDLYGLRYLPNGNLVGAAYGQARLVELSTGTVVDYVPGTGPVNGVQPDFEGRIWATNGSQVLRVDTTPLALPVVASATASNGVVYDPDRGQLFFTNYTGGIVMRIEIDTDGDAVGTPVEVSTISGAFLDGMALDVCGNLYVVDQGGNMIYRVFLDDAGDAEGAAEELLTGVTASNIANAQFGVGDGWDEQTLYAIGNPGELYAVEVGVPGAPYPVPEPE